MHILYIVRPVRFLTPKFTQNTLYPLLLLLLILVINTNKDNPGDTIFFFVNKIIRKFRNKTKNLSIHPQPYFFLCFRTSCTQTLHLLYLLSNDNYQKRKMRKKNIFVWLLPVILFAGLHSCMDDEASWREERTYLLCSQVWVDYYIDDQGVESEQILGFDSSGYGWETIIHYHRDGEETKQYEFLWAWENDRYTSIYIEYDYNDYLYFDDVSVTYNRLRGYFGGIWVEYEPYFP